MTFVARVRGNAANYLRVCRGVLQEVDREIPIYDIKTLDERLSEALARPRFYTTIILFLGGFALLLAVTGVYGVAAYSITQRTHEMGVRMALGAAPVRLRIMLVRQSMIPVVVGLAAGVMAAAALGRYLKYLMTSTETVGTVACVAAALLLAATAAVAVWVATSRILRIDPASALRAE
jgi:ABC-type antimicrobial peptide transport system permease subunit